MDLVEGETPKKTEEKGKSSPVASPSHFIFAATRGISDGQSNLVRNALAREEEKKAASEESKSKTSSEESKVGILSRMQSAKRTKRDAGEEAFAAQLEKA